MKKIAAGILGFVAGTIFCLAGFAIAMGAEAHYHLIRKIPIPGDGGWDYVEADSDARRLYVSHDTEIVVLDLRKQERARWRSIEGRATSMLRGQNLGRNRRPVLKTRGGELQ